MRKDQDYINNISQSCTVHIFRSLLKHIKFIQRLSLLRTLTIGSYQNHQQPLAGLWSEYRLFNRLYLEHMNRTQIYDPKIILTWSWDDLMDEIFVCVIVILWLLISPRFFSLSTESHRCVITHNILSIKMGNPCPKKFRTLPLKLMAWQTLSRVILTTDQSLTCNKIISLFPWKKKTTLCCNQCVAFFTFHQFIFFYFTAVGVKYPGVWR